MIFENEYKKNHAIYEQEWPELAQMYRTSENITFGHLVRTGALWSVPVTNEVTNAIRQTSQELISAAMGPQDLIQETPPLMTLMK